ncbi:MAG TPA: HlyD family efflux transporter periplasmic adaptor subunit [Steroidobacteraceae bacterium]
MNSPDPAADAATSDDGSTGKRRRGLLLLALVVLIVGIAWFAYWSLHGRWYVATDDAYAGGTVVQITAEVAGTVRTVHPRETESVAAGQTLIELDPADARIAMDAAIADLGSTVRQVRGAYPQAGRLRAQITARETDLARAREDYRRRASIAAGGAVSAEELAHAGEVVKSAEAGLQAAREELNVALAQTGGIDAANHPQVLRAAARVREAALALDRTKLVAPVDGVVARKGVQVGQRVNAGTPLMALVQMRDMWVDANFKEVQLQHMRIGQPVELESDLYGSDVVYHGRIKGFSPGTGAAFALLPAQNASGNWIKIVQRVPVRIALDPRELAEHPLRVGLSMHARVDVHDQSGPVLGEPTQDIAGTMPSREARNEKVEALIAQVIAANSTH